MKKLLLILIMLCSFNSQALEFEACGEKWRVHHWEDSELLSLDRWNGSKYVFTVTQDYDDYVKNKYTVDEFIIKFLELANDKLQRTCDEYGGGVIPTDWIGYLTYSVNHRLSYDAQNNIIIVD